MKITEKKTVTKDIDVVTDIRCNLCGESCLDRDEPHNDLGVEVNIHGCYGSAFPADMTSWQFHLCELCVAFLVSRFKIFPSLRDEMEMVDADKQKAMLTEGKTEGYVDWVVARYAEAMSRAALFASSETESRAAMAARDVAKELERQRVAHRNEAWAMHGALDKIAAPHGGGDGYPVDRVLALAGSTDDRLVEVLRKLYAVASDGFDRKPVEERVAARALDEAAAYLTAHSKL